MRKTFMNSIKSGGKVRNNRIKKVIGAWMTAILIGAFVYILSGMTKLDLMPIKSKKAPGPELVIQKEEMKLTDLSHKEDTEQTIKKLINDLDNQN